MWATYEVTLLAKIASAIKVKDFRPIAVLPVIYKLYSRVLYMLGETTCRSLTEPQFAFRKFHQAHEVVFILRQLVEKAVEWRAPMYTSWTETSRKRMTSPRTGPSRKQQEKKGMDDILILAWLREWRGMKSIFRLDAETKSGEVPRTRSLPQGDPAAPMLFNLVLDTLAERFVKNMFKKEVGKQLQDGTWVNIILFADNYWLVATDPEMLRKMTEAWLDMLAEYGWETPVQDLTWCSTALDNERAQFKVRGQDTLRTAANVGFKVLGTMLTFDNKYDVELEYRLTRANGAFYANWDLLGCKTVPLNTRLRVFRAVVDAALFFCAPGLGT